MKKIFIITRRELASFFDSLTAYVMIILFLGLSGLFTWIVGSNVFVMGQASMAVFFNIAFWSLFFFIPAITMKMIAEENRAGTIELLITKAATDTQIIMGKFLASLLLVIIALACTVPYYITISRLGNIDDGSVIGGYLALVLMSSAYIAIGLFASSITTNQIVAFLTALFIGIFFHVLFDVLGDTISGVAGQVIGYMSTRAHFDSMSRGVIDSRDLIFFGSLIGMGLLLSQIMLSKRNWQS